MRHLNASSGTTKLYYIIMLIMLWYIKAIFTKYLKEHKSFFHWHLTNVLHSCDIYFEPLGISEQVISKSKQN